jgi:hypothetical protein
VAQSTILGVRALFSVRKAQTSLSSEFGINHAQKEAVGGTRINQKNPARSERVMSIQKKSLINTLKATKKANIVKEDFTVSGATASPVMKSGVMKSGVMKSGVMKSGVMKSGVMKSGVNKNPVRK